MQGILWGVSGFEGWPAVSGIVDRAVTQPGNPETCQPCEFRDFRSALLHSSPETLVTPWSTQSTFSTLIKLVLPATPTGTPAIMRTVSPRFTSL